MVPWQLTPIESHDLLPGEEQVVVRLESDPIGVSTRRFVIDTATLSSTPTEAIADAIYSYFVLNVSPRIVLGGPARRISVIASRLKRMLGFRWSPVVASLFGQPLTVDTVTEEPTITESLALCWSNPEPRWAPRNKFAIGINLGSTYTRLVAIHGGTAEYERSEVLWAKELRGQDRWGKPTSYDELLNGLVGIVRCAADEFGLAAQDLGTLGIGGGLAAGGTFLPTANIGRAMSRTDALRLPRLRVDLERATQLPTVIAMDSKALAIAESRCGAARSALAVKIGTSLAGKAIASDGSILDTFEEGRHLQVNESPLALMSPHAMVRGSAKDYATASGAVAIARAITARAANTFEDVLRWGLGDAQARRDLQQVLEHQSRYLAVALVKWQSLTGARRIIISGRNLDGDWGVYHLAAIRRNVVQLLGSDAPEITLTSLTPDTSVALGAAILGARMVDDPGPRARTRSITSQMSTYRLVAGDSR